MSIDLGRFSKQQEIFAVEIKSINKQKFMQKCLYDMLYYT